MLCLLAASLVLTVLLQHHIRHLETRYYQALQQKAELDEEWGRLMLEKSHLSSPGRVERAARENLDMNMPKPQQVIVLPTRETR